MRASLTLAILYVSVGFSSAYAAAEARRFALVVGNSAYSALPPLPTAVEEARRMSAALRDSGFHVTTAENFRMPDFLAEYEAPFLKQIEPGDLCFFYFSGYALQVVDEDNYLIPTNFEPNDSRPMQERAYRLRRLQLTLEARKVELKIFALEAPRPIGLPIKGGVSEGLIVPSLNDSRETLFSFAAAPGQTLPAPASQTFGLFTRFLIENLQKSGLQPAELFQAVKRDVGRETNGQQVPYVSDNIVTESFYFRAPEKKPDPTPVVIVKTETVVKTETPQGFPAPNKRDREEYVSLPAGKFKMGCVPSTTKCGPNENPQHEITLTKPFWMGRNEVQVASYQRFVDANKQERKMPGPPLYNPRWRTTNLPMVMVSWEDAKAYCAWAGGRLPTEAEWEYAARSGKNDEVFPLNDENSRDKANFFGTKGNDRFDFAAPVRSFDANAFGLFDMAGNVWEWVNDYYAPDYYARSPATDPRGPDAGKEHVIRGGSFDSDPKEHLRLSFRKGLGKGGNSVGLRCVLDDTPETKALLGR